MAFNGVTPADKLVSPSYGLFSVATVKERGIGDEHWGNGFFVESAACGGRTEGVPYCASTSTAPYTIFDGSASSPYFHVAPFGILEFYECDNSVGHRSAKFRETVVKLLEAVSEFAVERELWLGTAAQLDDNPEPAARWLTEATDVTPVAGTAVKPALAVALVEQAFASANPGVQATIHITPLIASILGAAGYFEEDGNSGRLVTVAGSLVSISRGGDGDEGPAAGGSATKHWVYATGPVHVDLGAEELVTISLSESVNASTNEVIYAAERPAAVYFDGCSWFGALADATL
jgi:hypothetical protein